ncbi:hypothetical protein Bca4012_025586 [Brassica carinata]
MEISSLCQHLETITTTRGAAMASVLFSAAILVCLLPVSVFSYGLPAALKLERAVPSNHEMEMNVLKARERARHGRLLQSLGGVVDFLVDGTFDPFVVGLYYTKLRLGSPPREFYVQIDTGSDVLWVSCASCNGCPQTSGLQIQLNYFDPGSSVTATPISISDQRCSWGVQSSDSGCFVQNNLCAYTFQYGDGSGTSGYYVSDVLLFDMIVGSSLVPNSTAPVVFDTSQTGDLVV